MVCYSSWVGLNEEITLKEILTGISVEDSLFLLVDLAYYKNNNKIRQELQWPVYIARETPQEKCDSAFVSSSLSLRVRAAHLGDWAWCSCCILVAQDVL